MKIRCPSLCTCLFVIQSKFFSKIGCVLNLKHWAIGSGLNVNDNDDEDYLKKKCSETNDDKICCRFCPG